MTEKPKVISFIGYFYLFGAIILLATMNTAQDVPFNVRLGIPQAPELLVRICLTAVTAVVACGYVKLYRWGFWAMLVYSAVLLVISLTIMMQNNTQPFIGNAIFSAFVLIYTVIKRRVFVSLKRNPTN